MMQIPLDQSTYSKKEDLDLNAKEKFHYAKESSYNMQVPQISDQNSYRGSEAVQQVKQRSPAHEST